MKNKLTEALTLVENADKLVRYDNDRPQWVNMAEALESTQKAIGILRALAEARRTPAETVSREAMEALAADEHDRWAGQARTALDEMTPERRERWDRLSKTPYADLTDEMKELDRMQVRERLEIMARFGLLPAPQPVSTGEVGWLIEKKVGGTAVWWCPGECVIPGFTIDSNRAVRFSRKEDADRVREKLMGEGAYVTEHVWHTASRPPVPSVVGVPSAEFLKRVRLFLVSVLAIQSEQPELFELKYDLLKEVDHLLTRQPEMGAVVDWKGILEAVIRESARKSRFEKFPEVWTEPENAPGHAHSEVGIWDSDNGDLAGKPCAWCLAWNEARKALAAIKEGVR